MFPTHFAPQGRKNWGCPAGQGKTAGFSFENSPPQAPKNFCTNFFRSELDGFSTNFFLEIGFGCTNFFLEFGLRRTNFCLEIEGLAQTVFYATFRSGGSGAPPIWGGAFQLPKTEGFCIGQKKFSGVFAWDCSFFSGPHKLWGGMPPIWGGG